MLYAVDVTWVIFIWLTKKWRPEGRRPRVPWWWAYQNALLILLIAVPGWYLGDFYSWPMLTWLAVTHMAAFIHSVVLYDFHELLD